MQNPSYLSLSRHNIYYLRFPIPALFHPEGRTTDLKVSLATRDPRQALSISRFLVQYGERLLNHKTVVGMNYKELRDTLQGHFTGLLQAQKDKLLLSGRLDDRKKKAYNDIIEDTEDDLRNGWSILDDYNPDFYKKGVAKFIDKHNLNIVPEGTEYETLTREYKIHFRDFCRAVLAYDESFNRATFEDDKPFNSSSSVLRPTIKLTDAIDTFIADRLSKKRTGLRTSKSYRAELELLAECLGTDAYLPIGKRTAQTIVSMLMKVPTNRNQDRYKGLNIEELMELDAKTSPKLSLKTVKKYLSHYGAFYSWAIGHYEEDLGRNPFVELQKSIGADDQDEGRSPFSPEEVRLLLNTLTVDETSIHRKLHHKWGTLIGLYTGARRNEIAQLELDDIQELDGVLCFDLNATSKHGTLKKLKTKNSRRTIPVHSDLVRYGFLDYVQSMRNAGHARLFPELNYDANEEGYGRSLGRWFNDILLPHLSIKRPGLVFHSFRHTINYKLHNAGVPEIMVNCITGHERKGVNQKYYMKKGFEPRNLQEAIERVRYD